MAALAAKSYRKTQKKDKIEFLLKQMKERKIITPLFFQQEELGYVFRITLQMYINKSNIYVYVNEEEKCYE